jgi:hypothetical protein
VPYLSHATPLGDRFTLQGTLRTHLPMGSLGDGDLELSEVAHWLPKEWPRGVFPGLELMLKAPFDANERWRVSLIPQLHLAFSKRGHVALNLGVELPLAGARQRRSSSPSSSSCPPAIRPTPAASGARSPGSSPGSGSWAPSEGTGTSPDSRLRGPFAATDRRAHGAGRRETLASPSEGFP